MPPWSGHRSLDRFHSFPVKHYDCLYWMQKQLVFVDFRFSASVVLHAQHICLRCCRHYSFVWCNSWPLVSLISRAEEQMYKSSYKFHVIIIYKSSLSKRFLCLGDTGSNLGKLFWRDFCDCTSSLQKDFEKLPSKRPWSLSSSLAIEHAWSSSQLNRIFSLQ